MSILAAELSGFAGAVRADHDNLEGLIVRLRQLCVSLRACEPENDCNPSWLIEEFESELIPHFAVEQAEELLGSLATDQPHMLTWVERLQEEHRQMADAVDGLLEFAKSDPGPELAFRLEEFLDSLAEHEDAENALMREFFRLGG